MSCEFMFYRNKQLHLLTKIYGLVGNKIINDTDDVNSIYTTDMIYFLMVVLSKIKTDPRKVQHQQRIIRT